jgi:hypothetical protein
MKMLVVNKQEFRNTAKYSKYLSKYRGRIQKYNLNFCQNTEDRWLNPYPANVDNMASSYQC